MSTISVSASVAAKLEAIRQDTGDTVSIDDVAEVVSSLMASLEGDITVADLRLHRELNGLIEIIQKARADIAAIRPQQIRDTHIPTATDELDAVVQATEQAASAFMDAADELGRLAELAEDGMSEQLRALSTRIYEASSFQDITGQRISKVVSALRQIEGKVTEITHVVDGGPSAGETAADPQPAVEDPEKELLNGPALPGNANSQEDIDAILASFE